MMKNKRFFNNLAKDNVANLNEIRIHNIRYICVWILYYAFVFLYVTLWSNSEIYSFIYSDIDKNNLLYTMLLFTAVFLFMFKKHYFKTASEIGAAGSVISLIVLTAVNNEIIDFIFLVFFGISLSLLNVGIMLTYAFILNNTEKILSVIGSNLLSILLSFIPSYNVNEIFMKILAIFFLALSVFPVFIFKNEDMSENKENAKNENPKEDFLNSRGIAERNKQKEKETVIPLRVYLFLLIGFANAFLCVGVGRASLISNIEISNLNLIMFYHIGGILGCVVYILIVSLSDHGIQLGLNSTFGLFAMALFFNVYSDLYPNYSAIFAFLCGISTIASIINNFYLLGLISKKYDSLAFLRLGFIFIFVLGGLASVIIGDYMTNENFLNVVVIATLFSLCIMISLLIISPVLNDTLYSEDWVKDTKRFEITPEEKNFLESYGLTEREAEVCKLLIEGDTMRKISAKLSIAYPTVNTYCTSIYRKLNINSRTELLIRFMENKK